MYNDIRLRNIIVHEDSIQLIDFGNSMEYLDPEGNHILNHIKLRKFKGNTIIASVNAMQFGRPSRKDDLISLAYLLLTLSEEFEVVRQDASHMGELDFFRHVLNLKKTLTIEDYCHSPDSRLFRPFISEVWGLQYEEKPDYEKLKFTLVGILLGNDILPTGNLFI